LIFLFLKQISIPKIDFKEESEAKIFNFSVSEIEIEKSISD